MKFKHLILSSILAGTLLFSGCQSVSKGTVTPETSAAEDTTTEKPQTDPDEQTNMQKTPEPPETAPEELPQPELTYDKISSLDWTIQVSDCSTFVSTDGMKWPFTITYPEEYIRTDDTGAEILVLTEDMAQNEKVSIPITITDASGQSAEQTIDIHIIDESTAPDWYHLLMESELLVDFIDFLVSCELTKGYTYEANSPEFWNMMQDVTYGYMKHYLAMDIQPDEIAKGMQIANDLGSAITENWQTEDWQPENLQGQDKFIRWVFYSGFQIIPENVLLNFKDSGGSIILTDIPLEVQDAWGFYSPDEILIKVTTSIEHSKDLLLLRSEPRMTLVHEIGHYVDHTLGWRSSSDEWKSHYENTKALLSNGNFPTEYAFSMETASSRLFNPEDCYQEYSLTSEAEFFADTFFLYCEHLEALKEMYPEIYASMDACVQQM